MSKSSQVIRRTVAFPKNYPAPVINIFCCDKVQCEDCLKSLKYYERLELVPRSTIENVSSKPNTQESLSNTSRKETILLPQHVPLSLTAVSPISLEDRKENTSVSIPSPVSPLEEYRTVPLSPRSSRLSDRNQSPQRSLTRSSSLSPTRKDIDSSSLVPRDRTRPETSSRDQLLDDNQSEDIPSKVEEHSSRWLAGSNYDIRSNLPVMTKKRDIPVASVYSSNNGLIFYIGDQEVSKEVFLEAIEK